MTAVHPVDSRSTSLALMTRASEMLAQATTIQKAKELKDLALTAQEWAKRKNAGDEAVEHCRTYALLAERRLGELLAATERAKGAPGPGRGKACAKAGQAFTSAPTLPELGVTRKESARAQELAALPSKAFQSILDGEPLAAVLRERHRSDVRSEKVARPFPSGRFAVVYADPPWSYSNSGLEQSAASQYPTMATDEIAALPVADLCGDWTVLFLWATAPLLTDALRVMREWGFSYKSCAVWVKDRAPGMGWWLKTRHELLLIGVRGNPPQPAEKSDSVIDAAVRSHSEKPTEAYKLIERAYSDVPRVELFARSERAGWTAWGNEPADRDGTDPHHESAQA